MPDLLYMHKLLRASSLVCVFAAMALLAYAVTLAATYARTSEAEAGNTSGAAFTMPETNASAGTAIQFGSKPSDCNNFCSHPINPIYKTAPVSINTNVNTAWCGPTWDAPQAEFDSARQKMGAGAILMPPCKKGAGYYDQTPEQYKVELDKAQKAGVKVLVFGGYTCTSGIDHNCYAGFTNPDGMIDKFAYHPALAGFFIHDEPPANEFAATAKAVDRIHLRRPGLLAYTNLFGSNGSSTTPHAYLGTHSDGSGYTYDQYLDAFMSTIKINVLSVDDYSSPANLDFTLQTITKWANRYATSSRPDLANRSLWSAISTVGFNNGQDLEYFRQNQAAYQASNDKWSAKTLYFTWRSPPGDGDGFTQPEAGPALCGLVNNYNPGTMCGN
jgi:hypothetical protein